MNTTKQTRKQMQYNQTRLQLVVEVTDLDDPEEVLDDAGAGLSDDLPQPDGVFSDVVAQQSETSPALLWRLQQLVESEDHSGVTNSDLFHRISTYTFRQTLTNSLNLARIGRQDATVHMQSWDKGIKLYHLHHGT